MIGGLQERRLGPRGNIKVRSFPGATTNDMLDYLQPLLRKKPDRIILHVGTNDAIDHSAKEITEKIINLKNTIEKGLKGTRITISSPVNRLDNPKCAVTIRNLNASLENTRD